MRAGIIGLGRMGRRHIKVIKCLGWDLAGVYDIKKESLYIAIKEENISKDIIFSPADELLEKCRLDCIIISTTAPTHCHYTKMAAKAKIPYILCEKPMATSLSECNEMIEVCKKNNCKLAINHQMMFMEQYTKVKEIISGKEFGGLASINVIAGNFGFAMNGTHYFEMFRYLTEEEPYMVMAWFSNEIVSNPRGAEFQDRGGQLRFITKSGKRFYMDVGTDQGHWIIVNYAGKNGILVADELNGKIFFYKRKKEFLDYPTTKYAMPGDCQIIEVKPADVIEPTAKLLKAMVKGEEYPKGEYGMLSISVLVAAYKSNDNNNKFIKLNDLKDYYNLKFQWG